MKDNKQKKCNNFMLIFIMLTCREKQELVRAALLTDQRCAGEISSRHAVSSVALANTSSLRCQVGHAARSARRELFNTALFRPTLGLFGFP